MNMARRLAVLLAAAIPAMAVACGEESVALSATGPFVYPAAVSPSLERVAIVVTITNRSGDDLQVNPADFVARDAGRRIYAANPTATVADAGLVSRSAETRGTLPLPVIMLRNADVLSGFVVFDVPADVRPVELVWRQTDADQVAKLASPR